MVTVPDQDQDSKASFSTTQTRDGETLTGEHRIDGSLSPPRLLCPPPQRREM